MRSGRGRVVGGIHLTASQQQQSLGGCGGGGDIGGLELAAGGGGRLATPRHLRRKLLVQLQNPP